VDSGRTQIAAQPARRLEQKRSLLFPKRDPDRLRNAHPKRPREHRCQSEERNAELLYELNGYGPRACEESDHEQNG
jgi:hypothetical protein